MKKQLLKSSLILLSIVLSNAVFAQTVQLCVTINGTAMPVNRQAYMCKTNSVTTSTLSQVTLSATNCAATPELNVTIKWKNLDVAPYTDSVDNVITATQIGRWEATITNNTNASITKDTVFLAYHPNIGIVMNDGLYNPNSPPGAPAGCPLNTFTLTSTPSGPVTGYKWYNYSPKALIPGISTSSFKINKRNSYYIVEANDANGCVVADTSTSFFNQRPTLAVVSNPDPLVFCEGGTFNLFSSVTVGYPAIPDHQTCWGYNPGAFDDPLAPPVALGCTTKVGDAPIPSIIVTPPGGINRFWIKVSKFPYCDNSDTTVITTKPIPVVDIGPASKMVCFGSDSTLKSTVSIGTAPFSYTWTSVPSGTYPSTANITITPAVPTIYTLNVTDVNNCGTGTDNISISINPEIVTTVSNDTTICRSPEGTANLNATASGGVGTLTFKWLPAAGLSFNTILSPTATPILPTFIAKSVYTFFATDANSCPSIGKPVSINYFVPSIAPIAEPVIISETKSTVLDASNSSNTGFSFKWKTDDASAILSFASSLPVTYQGPDTVNYVIIVQSNYTSAAQLPLNGCINSDTIEVRSISDNTLLYVPNVFSPNAFDVENQKLKIYGDNLLDDGFKMVVYNKWGNLVYESNNLSETKSKGWDGGAKVEGVYTYVIVGKFKNGKDVKESPYNKGTFSLIR